MSCPRDLWDTDRALRYRWSTGSGSAGKGAGPGGLRWRVSPRRLPRFGTGPVTRSAAVAGRSPWLAGGAGEDRGELVQVDVAAGDHADDLPRAGLAGPRGGQGERTRALGDHPAPLG